MEKAGEKPSFKKEREFLAEEATKSPKKFIGEFLKSELFIKGRHNSLEGGLDLRGLDDFNEELKKRGIDESEQEIRRVFYGMEDTKMLLLYFAKYQLMLKYDENEFNVDVRRSFHGYQSVVRRNNSERTKLNLQSVPVDIRKERIQEMDAERQFKHYKVIHALVDGDYAPSEPIARAMARVMLISTGDDTFDRAQSDEEIRFRRLADAAVSGKRVIK